jgi:biotin-(acetyl-CoA carboxylase) ligase
MIKREEKNEKSTKVSGLIKSIENTKITIEEKKKEETLTDIFDLHKEFEPFVNTSVNFTISKTIKGIIESIDDNGINILDPKSGIKTVVSVDDFQSFIGSNIKFGISESSKSEVDEF